MSWMLDGGDYFMRLKLEKTMDDIEDKIGKEAEKRLNEQRERLEPKIEACKELEESDKTKEDIEKAMEKVLCWGDISYCCDARKSCPMRKSFLQALGLTNEDYEEFKQEMSREFLSRNNGG